MRRRHSAMKTKEQEISSLYREKVAEELYLLQTYMSHLITKSKISSRSYLLNLVGLRELELT